MIDAIKPAKRKRYKQRRLDCFPFPKDPSVDFIKRVVAMGGETVEVTDKEVFKDQAGKESASF